jgi:hypothetical protein
MLYWYSTNILKTKMEGKKRKEQMNMHNKTIEISIRLEFWWEIYGEFIFTIFFKWTTSSLLKYSSSR